jgi:hypothetical protein
MKEESLTSGPPSATDRQTGTVAISAALHCANDQGYFWNNFTMAHFYCNFTSVINPYS